MVRSSYRPLSREQMRAIAANPQYAPPPEAVRQGFNRTMYAGQDVAAGLGGMMGGTVRTSQASGGIDLPEHGLQFSNGEGNAPSEVLNAGLLQDRIARGVGRGENPDYINASIRDQIIAPPGPRVSEFGVQPTSGAMTSADAERMYAGDPRFDPNMRTQPREIPNYRMGAGGVNHGPSGIDDGPPMQPQIQSRGIAPDPRTALRERSAMPMGSAGMPTRTAGMPMRQRRMVRGMGTPGMSNPRGTMGSRPTAW